MIRTEAHLEMDAEAIVKLGRGRGLWSAAHYDGSKSRIDGDAVLDAASYGIPLGILTALFMWIRKKYRNRGKSREELAAEQEAAGINRTCRALEAMLLEYIQAAQEGRIDEEALDELIGTLEEMHGYAQAGKLRIPDGEDLKRIRAGIAAYTLAIAGERNARPVPEAGTAGADEFSGIRDQLILQRKLLRDPPN